MRGHIRGPGGPLVLRLLPRGARDQPGGARAARPREAQSRQRDRDWGRSEYRASGRRAERHAPVSDALCSLSNKARWPHPHMKLTNQVIQRKSHLSI